MVKEIHYNIFQDKVADAIAKAKESGVLVYKELKIFKAFVKIPAKSSHNFWTTVAIDGRIFPFYHVGKKGPKTNVLNMSFFGITDLEIGKIKKFVCALEIKALPNGKFFLGLKLVRKDFDGEAPELTVVTDGQVPKRATMSFQAQGMSTGGVSPLVVLKQRK